MNIDSQWNEETPQTVLQFMFKRSIIVSTGKAPPSKDRKVLAKENCGSHQTRRPVCQEMYYMVATDWGRQETRHPPRCAWNGQSSEVPLPRSVMSDSVYCYVVCYSHVCVYNAVDSIWRVLHVVYKSSSKSPLEWCLGQYRKWVPAALSLEVHDAPPPCMAISLVVSYLVSIVVVAVLRA